MHHIPLLAEEGWLRHQENAAKPQKRRRRGGQFGWPLKPCRTDHPVRDKIGTDPFLLMSRPPLLCEEGNVLSHELAKIEAESLLRRLLTRAAAGGIGKWRLRVTNGLEEAH